MVIPSTNCYALDNSIHLVDFNSWNGHVFEYDGKEADLAVRFCKDKETRPNLDFVDFGRFDKSAGSGHINFVQCCYNGDLRNCQKIYEKLGRTSQVNIICGSCLPRCMCDVTYESLCIVLVELVVPCEKNMCSATYPTKEREGPDKKINKKRWVEDNL